MPETEFWIVRHGCTDANTAGILQGHFESRLDDTGIQQAQALAKRLKSEKFDAFYCSTLKRAVHTAGIIGEAINRKAIELDELTEWDLGILERRPHTELRMAYPDLMASFHTECGDFDVPGGESRKAFYQRVSRILDTLAGRHAGQKILLVTHGGTLRAIFHHMVGPVTGGILPQTDNAGLSRFRHKDGRWQLISWNETFHLHLNSRNTSTL